MQEQLFSGVSRAEEELHLEGTLAVVRENIRNYRSDTAKMRDEIDDMLEHFHDDNPELINTLENTITMYDNLHRALLRNERAVKKPYFGRVIFHDEALDKEESLYIGRSGISRNATHLEVIDWRAPVANAYYENGLGKCSYKAPDNKELSIDLKLKRTYEIEEGKLINYFDTEVVSNDELLTKYLSKNKEAVSGEIVATIQKEQNEIIRKSPYHNLIVQGVAGSGKTTVAMHRISYILYNYAQRFKPEDFYIVGSNRILLDYITGVLPELDVQGVCQMTMEQLFVRLLYEDWDDKKYRIRYLHKAGVHGAVKGSQRWFHDLEHFCSRLEWDTICREDIYITPLRAESIRIVEGSSVEQYILKNPTVSLQNKINTLNERLLGKAEDEFIGKAFFTEQDKKESIKSVRGRYGASRWKKSVFAMYEDFLKEQQVKGLEVDICKTEFDVYDLAALAYLYKRIKETECISEAHHVVIDEAQDYGMMAYCVLKFCIRDCTYTIMGDVSQNIHFGYGLNDWEELKKLYMTTDRASFQVLKKSYRNTVEISDFATKILRHGQFSIYPVEPIIRHGKPVEVQEVVTDRFDDIEEAAETKGLCTGIVEKAAEICKKWQEKGLATIAVICRNAKKAAQTAQALSEYADISDSDPEHMEFGNGIMVLPVEYTKGLEFDAVLILEPTKEAYPKDDAHTKLLYVAATRALHELCILHTGNLTELLSETASDRKQFFETEPVVQTVSAVAENSVWEKDQKTTPVVTQKACAAVSHSLGNTAKTGISYHAQSTMGVTVSCGTKPSISYGTKPTVGAGMSRSATFAAGVKRPGAVRNMSGTAFGNMPLTELLRPAGHGKIDLAVQWVSKESDGIYLQSKYGVLRLCPVRSDIIRITFAKGTHILSGRHEKINPPKSGRACRYKDSSGVFELVTDKLHLQVDKRNGNICYRTRDKKLLLQERKEACRQFDITPKGMIRSWLYLDWQKGEKLYGHRILDRLGPQLRGTARYISHTGSSEDLPFLVSDQGYGIVLASDGAAFVCDIAVYGSYIYTENIRQLDYYFIQGKDTMEILQAYEFLKGNF